MKCENPLFFGRYGLLDEHGEEYAEDEDTQDDSQRNQRGDMPVEELAANHLDADEGEQHTKSVVEHPEAVGDIAQEEEKRTQTHDSEDIGSIDNDWILGHREDGRNGVDGEDDIGKFNDQQHQEKGRHLKLKIEN